MNLTFSVFGKGYVIYNNGSPWIKQDDFIPYPGPTVSQSAKNHISKLLSDFITPPQVPMDQQLIALNDKLDNAIMELTMLIMMGGGMSNV